MCLQWTAMDIHFMGKGLPHPFCPKYYYPFGSFDNFFLKVNTASDILCLHIHGGAT